MLEAAIAEARKGKYVMVVAAHISSAQQLRDRCAEMSGGERVSATKVKINGGEITFEVPSDLSWDWKTLRFRHAWPNIPYFIDHYAAEQRRAELQAEIDRLLIEEARWEARCAYILSESYVNWRCNRLQRDHEVCPCEAKRERGEPLEGYCACLGPIRHPFQPEEKA